MQWPSLHLCTLFGIGDGFNSNRNGSIARTAGKNQRNKQETDYLIISKTLNEKNTVIKH